MIRTIVSDDHNRIKIMMLTMNMMKMIIIIVLPCTIKVLIIRYSSGTISNNKIGDIINNIVSITIITVVIADTSDSNYNDDT